MNRSQDEPNHDQDRRRSGYLSIGTFSRASLLSIKALRAYHDSGLLVPADIDQRTGYRRYHHTQLADAGVVRRLRDLDVGLVDVARILDARDPLVTREVLLKHEHRKRLELERTVRIVEELTAGVETPALHSPIHLRQLAASHVLAVEDDVEERDFPIFLGTAYAELGRVMSALDVEAIGPSGALYPPSIADDGAGRVVAYQTVAEPLRAPAAERGRVKLDRLPGHTCAVAVHHGGYDTIDITYRMLGSWISKHGTAIDAPVREHYLVSYDALVSPEEFRTEILWPVGDVDPSPNSGART